MVKYSKTVYLSFCREVMVKYWGAVYDLTKKLGTKLMEGLGLESGDLFEDWPCLMRFNKYNNNPETVGLTGARTHSDKGVFTILLDDEFVNGLEMLDEQTGEFIPANPIPGSFFVNAGDIAKVSQVIFNYYFLFIYLSLFTNFHY